MVTKVVLHTLCGWCQSGLTALRYEVFLAPQGFFETPEEEIPQRAGVLFLVG